MIHFVTTSGSTYGDPRLLCNLDYFMCTPKDSFHLVTAPYGKYENVCPDCDLLHAVYHIGK